jgi:hypothetical protein
MMKPRRRICERGFRRAYLSALALSLLLTLAGAQAAESGNLPQRRFDLLIRGGEVIDGSGAARYRADVSAR